MEAVLDLAEGRPGIKIPQTFTHKPSTSSFYEGRALRLAVDPDLALTVGAWDLGLVFDPVTSVEGWRLVGALGPAPEDPDLSACLADLRRA